MNRRAFVTLLSAGAAMAQGGKPEVAGAWEGTLSAGGAKLRLTMAITKTVDGVYLGTMVSLDQGNVRLPIDLIEVHGRDVHFEIKTVNGKFDGKLDAESKNLAGTWNQVTPLPLEFTRTAAPSSPPETKAAEPKSYPMGLPLDVYAPISPVPFPAKGKSHLCYELYLTSYGEVTLQRLDVLSGTREIASFEGGELNGMLHRIGGNGEDKRVLDTGRRTIVFLWLDGDVGGPIRHRLAAGTATVESRPLELSTMKPLVVGAPLRGSVWFTGNGPGNNSIHRRAGLPVDGRISIAQRFAIDFLKVDGGKRLDGDEKVNKSYYAYGNEVLAVSDGLVASIKDGIPENVPGVASRAVPMTMETLGGNFIVHDVGSGQYAFYGHLQPGSLRVKPGDRVKRGQVLGLLGNSGNSTEPHLHFHVMDGPSPLGSEGVPYLFEATGREMPLQNDRVTFG